MLRPRLPRLFLTLLLVFLIGGNANLTSGTAYSESEILTFQEEIELNKILSADIIQRLDSLFDVYANRKQFNGNVLVALNGYKVFERSAGYSDPMRKEPADISSVYQLASVSKQFTAAAIMLLKADNRLDFEDNIVKYIPELPYKNVRISHLLHHTSGLPNYFYLVGRYWNKKDAPDNEDVVSLMAKYKQPVSFRAGSRYQYSNTGYVLLGTIVERITGLSLNEFLQRRVFIPLGMNDTYIYSIADSVSIKKHVEGFKPLKSGYIRISETKNNGPVGDKGVCTTIDDLFKWDQALYSGFPIGHDMLKEAFSPVKCPGGQEVPYGFGFRLRTYNNADVIYHNGLWEGFRTNFHRYPDSRNTIIVFNNTSSRVNHMLVSQIESIIFNCPADDVVKKLVNIAVDQGCEDAYDYYLTLEQMGKSEQVDIERLKEACAFMQETGKMSKAAELTKFIGRIQLSDKS